MDQDIINKHVKAGKILVECLKYGEKMIKPGASILEICDKVEEKITSMDGGIAFPAQISKNSVAAHDCPNPNDERTCDEGDVVKLDIGVHIDGRIADSAVTVNLGDHDDLVKSSKEALKAAIGVVGIGVKVSEVGKAIQEVIESHGFAPVRNLSGHGLNKYVVHDIPSVPNFDTGSDVVFQEGMVVAVEPFSSTGAGIVYESSNPTVFMQHSEKPVRSRMARMLMKDILSYNGLPFTTRWLIKKYSEGAVRLGLRELVLNGIVKEYPPLIDKEGGMISQAEHSIIIKDKPIIITKS